MRLENKDFEEAYKIYKEILNDSPNDPEVYWGMLLCRFGIEYVKDGNGEYLPTCHRTIQGSITQDTDFLEALSNADSNAFEYYKAQGLLIDTYQKKIKSIVANEKPYDVFISFKSTDENGFPTKESILSQKIYNYLTKDLKLKVFFSNVTLQNRAGEEYEPIIYAALRSSKVMVLVGCNKENINSTWVKNEWTRYINMIDEAKKENEKKRLIPALLDMKPEEMPSELLSFQAMDMSIPLAIDKLGNSIDMFIGDEKLSNKPELSEEKLSDNLMNKQAVNAYQFASQKLQAGDFDEAANSFRNALSNDITMHEAYWGLLLANNKAKNDEEFSKTPIEKLGEVMEFKNACGYAKEDKKAYYESFVKKCNKSYKLKVYQDKYNNDISYLYNQYANLSEETNISSSSKVTVTAFYNDFHKIDALVNEYYDADTSCKSLTKEEIKGDIIGSIISFILATVAILIDKGVFFKPGMFIGCIACIGYFAFIIIGIGLLVKFVYDNFKFKSNAKKYEQANQNYLQQKQIIYKRYNDIASDSQREIAKYNDNFVKNCEYQDEIKYVDVNYISSQVFSNETIEKIVDEYCIDLLNKIKEEQKKREEEEALRQEIIKEAARQAKKR